MTLKYYFAPYSTATVTTDVLNELELGLDKPLAERVEVSLGDSGDVRKEAYLAEVNPNGLVPALVHDGVQIWESAAVTMYLGELFGVDRPEPLYPAMGPRRGEAMKWIVWANLQIAVMANRIHVARADKKVSFHPFLSVTNPLVLDLCS
jgi:glutathione S-transferase